VEGANNSSDYEVTCTAAGYQVIGPLSSDPAEINRFVEDIKGSKLLVKLSINNPFIFWISS